MREFLNRMRILVAAGLLAPLVSAVTIAPRGNDGYARVGDDTVLTWRGTGAVQVLRPCRVELLLVGGGGGGGRFQDARLASAGGGGAGGFIHRTDFELAAGTYAVSVGAGGAVAANGDDTTAFGLTAHGGGAGGSVGENLVGANGGSGGGSSHLMAGSGSEFVAGGQPVDPAQGHAGQGSIHIYGAGGGGGAGADAPDDHSTPSQPSSGGDGLPCSISGQEVWYAGGGAGSRLEFPKLAGDRKPGGKGGGGTSGQPGTDGLGGGGSGGYPGGSGICILRFRETDSTATDDFNARGGFAHEIADGAAHVHVFRADGTLTVTGAGTVDILVVGGGGGGGVPANTDTGAVYGGGGGGAGGFVYYRDVPVAAGTYAVRVGAGGAVGTNGGDSSALGVTAYGGGFGAAARHAGEPGSGGSGGGATSSYDQPFQGGAASHAAEGNVGHAGGMGRNIWAPAGGGGAGEPGHDTDGSLAFAPITLPGAGGDGLSCDITGIPRFYAGGGAGYRVDVGADLAPGGKGGGGAGMEPGADGLGGGGGGGAPGGRGIVIVRVNNRPLVAQEAFEDATGGDIATWKGYRIHTFRESGVFEMPHDGLIEVLVVGGGGGGGLGQPGGVYCGGGGGGAGGYVHRRVMALDAGSYAVTVGAGGEVGENGGDTRVFDIVAHGGGRGARHQHGSPFAGDGGSGGGSSVTMTETAAKFYRAGGCAIHADDENLGHDGGSGCHIYGPTGGGGAGAPGGDSVAGRESTPTVGGDGLPNSITGAEVWYAGGGAGYRPNYKVSGGRGGGGSSGPENDAAVRNGVNGLGGGGAGDGRGGSGVVIIRYLRPDHGTVLLLR